MDVGNILKSVSRYYSQKIEAHGATAQGVDWNSPESQTLRFEQLLKICETTGPFSINDYGCGYGALVDYLAHHSYKFQYRGFDITDRMIEQASQRYGALAQCQFFTEASFLSVADYTVVSGVFNVKLQTDNATWQTYILNTLAEIDRLSRKGFAFNILTAYADKEYMRPDLYYADPLYFFDYCKKNFSRFVSLLHDYPLYEFTILVKK